MIWHDHKSHTAIDTSNRKIFLVKNLDFIFVREHRCFDLIEQLVGKKSSLIASNVSSNYANCQKSEIINVYITIIIVHSKNRH